MKAGWVWPMGDKAPWSCITNGLFAMDRDFLDLPEDHGWNRPQARGFRKQESQPWEDLTDYLGEREE